MYKIKLTIRGGFEQIHDDRRRWHGEARLAEYATRLGVDGTIDPAKADAKVSSQAFRRAIVSSGRAASAASAKRATPRGRREDREAVAPCRRAEGAGLRCVSTGERQAAGSAGGLIAEIAMCN